MISLAAAAAAVVVLSSIDPAAHRGLLLAQADVPQPPPPPSSYSSATDREVTIKALREEIVELSDQKSGIGYVFPIICIGAGAGLIAAGLLVNSSTPWVNTALLVSGTAIAALSTLWFILRLVRGISLGNQISDKEEQLRRLEAQRIGVSFGFDPRGGAYAALTVRL